MAIQHRRGAYERFDPSKLLPGEWAVVVSGDPSIADGRACYICFAAGDVKRMFTYEDATIEVKALVDSMKAAFASDVNKAAASANAAAGKAAEATSRANASADKADASAADALKAAEEARGSINPDKRLYIAYDAVGGTDYISLVDTEE